MSKKIFFSFGSIYTILAVILFLQLTGAAQEPLKFFVGLLALTFSVSMAIAFFVAVFLPSATRSNDYR